MPSTGPLDLRTLPSGLTVPGLPAPGRTLVFGVLNVTPDSFSDGGEFHDEGRAVRHGLEMAAEGADLVDVGGESTRPGATRVPVEEELRRVVPVVAQLVERGVTVSVDTTRGEVARAALDAGAAVVNDVSGGADPDLLAAVAAAGVPYICMHTRGTSADMQSHATYGDVVAEVRAELADRIAAAVAAGVDERLVVVDPGIGFAKTAAHNWTLLARMDELADLGRPLLVGTSRKSFLGRLLGSPDPGAPPGTGGQLPRPVDDRDDATQATTAVLALQGVWAVRVHAVRPAADAVRVAAALRAAGRRP
jgi:dihydropteroate synthase